MPDQVTWVDLYHPGDHVWHRVPDNPSVVQYFRDKGWETRADIAARAGAEAEELRGRALDEALDAAGLSKAGSADEKRERLAEYEARSVAETIEDEEEEV